MKWLNKLLLAGYEVSCEHHAGVVDPFSVYAYRYDEMSTLVKAESAVAPLCEEALQKLCKKLGVK